MQQLIEFWHWRVTDKVSRRCFVTRHRMTREDALDYDPAAERIEGTLERRVSPADAATMSRPSSRLRAASTRIDAV